MVWSVIQNCGGQVRAGLGTPYALDFTAILLMGSAIGANLSLLSDVLPHVEPLIVKAYRERSDDG